ncbi:MAG: hypothetical protein JW829_07230 [Pirellulales bacterium]|nr:hypothetical protein [Pirellulales bacterium]
MTAIGFLSFIDHPPQGILGGFLIVSPLGRPLEFHCSAPIQPNRAQEILYGPTLRPYLLGDLVGRTLVEHTELPVEVILVDSQEALELRMSVDVPVAAVFSDPAAVFSDPATIDLRQTSETLHANPFKVPDRMPNQVKIGPFLLVMARGYLEDARLLRNTLVPIIRDVDLCEPFERIREALMEAQRMSA